MELVYIVVLLVLIEYMVFSMLVGRARGKYGVSAPAITGDPIFERYYRVQQNTLEQLAVFLPAILVYGYYGNPMYAAIAGVFFLVGRAVYLHSYVADPGKRAIGFLLGFAANVFLVVGGLIVLIRSLMT